VQQEYYIIVTFKEDIISLSCPSEEKYWELYIMLIVFLGRDIITLARYGDFYESARMYN